MRVGAGAAHLCYCSNIHPGESWPEIRANLERYVVAVKEQVGCDGGFGVGLRLSARAADELAEADCIEELRTFLDSHGLYVFTVNAFPYGRFHGAAVKENVYLPDWLDDERLRYTNRVASLLARLLPDDPALEGSVSTVPGAYRTRASGDADADSIAQRMITHAAALADLERETGRTIALAIEPEPCCVLETIDETAAFFEERLLSRAAAERMAGLIGSTKGQAEQALRRHLGVCLDTCHAAVEFDEPAAAVARLGAAGIRIAKVQLSAGLRIERVDREAARALAAFDDGVYLHQVVERRGSTLRRFCDLGEALEDLERSSNGEPPEWRVHFHVPLFLEQLGRFASTQPFVRETLALLDNGLRCQHLEVETYTWDVLPPEHRALEVVEAVARELAWVAKELT